MYSQFKNPTVVQKYGGTSVGNIERIHQIARRIADQRAQGLERIAVVVSAMAGETNRLVNLVSEVDEKARAKIADVAISAGEQVSVALMAAALEKLGVLAEPMLSFQLGVLTDGLHSKARIHEINTEKIRKAWANKSIPVIAGFQGVTKDLQITTLGRGGTDTSAVALAAALEADFCEINTDVDGVYTADPRVVPDARLMECVDYSVALEMAALGSKVLHSRCVELGAKFLVPLVVRNSFKSNESKRTVIKMFSEKEALEAPVVSGVSVEKNVARIALKGVERNPEFISSIFEHVAEKNINVDIIVHNRLEDEAGIRVGFTVGEAELSGTNAVLKAMQKKPGFENMDIQTEQGLGKVSVVGLGMQSHHGVASRTFQALGKANIDIKMISTSEIKISCVVPGDLTDEAARILHKEFCASIS